jgi:hypothetical protein
MFKVPTDSYPFGQLHGCEGRQCSDWSTILVSSPGSSNIFLLSKPSGPGGGGVEGFLWLKRPVRELDLLPSSVRRVRMSGAIPLFSPVWLCITRGENVYN